MSKENTYVPFTVEDRHLFLGKTIKFESNSSDTVFAVVITCGSEGIFIPPNMGPSYADALQHLNFEDGTPFGKLAE